MIWLSLSQFQLVIMTRWNSPLLLLQMKGSGSEQSVRLNNGSWSERLCSVLQPCSSICWFTADHITTHSHHSEITTKQESAWEYLRSPPVWNDETKMRFTSKRTMMRNITARCQRTNESHIYYNCCSCNNDIKTTGKLSGSVSLLWKIKECTDVSWGNESQGSGGVTVHHCMELCSSPSCPRTAGAVGIPSIRPSLPLCLPMCLTLTALHSMRYLCRSVSH